MTSSGPKAQSKSITRLALKGSLLRELLGFMPIRRMVDAVIGRHIRNRKWIDALKAADVVAVLLRVRAPLVVSVDATVGAEVVPGCVCVELVELEMLRSPDDSDAAQWDRSNDRAFATADGTIAAPWIDNPIG
jgi:hypothetical protein